MGFTLHAVPTLRADLPTELSHSDKRSVKSLLKDVSAGEQKETLNWSHTYVFPPRPFRNGLKCAWQVQMIFSLLSEGVMVT